MPSFPTTNGIYQHCLSGIKNEQQNETKSKEKQFMMITICIILFTLIGLSPIIILNYVGDRNPTLYQNYFLYWIYDIYYSLFVTYCTLSIIIFLMPNITINKHFIYTALFLFIFLSSASFIPYSIAYEHRVYLLNKYFIDTFICNYWLCGYWYPFWLFLNILNSGFLPLLLFIFWKLFNCIFCRNNNNKSSLQLLQRKNSSIQSAALVLPASNDNNPYQSLINNTSYLIYCFVFLLLYFLTWSIFWIFYCLKNETYKNYYIYLYIGFYSWYKCTKSIVTRLICRKIDTYRLFKNNINFLNESGKLMISFEYFVNWVYLCIYWNWSKILIAYHTPNLNIFIILLCLHTIFELLEINMRLSTWYFYYRSIVLKYIFDHCEYLSFMVDIKNNFDEWRCRISMDFMLKFYASILNGILVALSIYCYGSTFFETLFGSKTYNKAITYTFVSTAFDMVYFIVTYYFHKKYIGFNLIAPFVQYLDKFSNPQIIFYFLLTVSIFTQLQK